MILAARLCVLLLVTVAAVGALVAGRDVAQGRPLRRYACPMHPQVAAAAPGSCVICGMALEPVQPRAAGESAIEAERYLIYGPAPVHRRALTAAVQSPAFLDVQGGVTAVLFQDELRDLAPLERGTFFAARDPATALAVERTAERPALWRGSMWHVRFRFLSGGPPGSRVGASGWLERPSAGHESLVVLSSAVLQTPTGPHLLAITPDLRHYRSLPVVTGRVTSGYTALVSGASERDLVLGLNVFSVAAEAQLGAQRRAAADGLRP